MFSSHLSYSGCWLLYDRLLPLFLLRARLPLLFHVRRIRIYLFLFIAAALSSYAAPFFNPDEITAAVCLSTFTRIRGIVEHRTAPWPRIRDLDLVRKEIRPGNSDVVATEMHHRHWLNRILLKFIFKKTKKTMQQKIDMFYMSCRVIYFHRAPPNNSIEKTPSFSDRTCVLSIRDLVRPLARFPLMSRSCGFSTVFWHSPMRNVDHYNTARSILQRDLFASSSHPPGIVATLSRCR